MNRFPIKFTSGKVHAGSASEVKSVFMRKSGILMHISSLPGPYGIGSMGKRAYEFVDFLCEAGQAFWQILPLTPTGYGDSPYQSFSTFAGNPYLIDLEQLMEEGLLEKEEAEAVSWSWSETRVDYGCLYNNRSALLRKAYARFTQQEKLDAFIEKHGLWLEDCVLFMALKERFGGQPWQNWPEALMLRQEDAIAQAKQDLAEEMRFHCFCQYIFFCQWEKLRRYANDKGLKIIGDVPIYVPLDSADVWARPDLFHLDEGCRPKVVAGCPPDSFSADGQLWGNPIYDWGKMKANGYRWWIRRLAAAAGMYDVVRFDHFRGFESYWSIPAGDTTAAGGHWELGPGLEFIRAIQAALPDLDFIAEDLGYVTPEVRQLQEDSGYPGMKVLQFAFDSRETSDYRPHTYPVNSVCYSGTHDNLTLQQWFDEAAEEDVTMAKDYLGLNEEEGYVRGMIRGCMSSVSKLCIIQMQDYLELGGFARMNFPGTLSSANWTWRAAPGFLSEELKERILETTRRYGRL